FEAFGFHAVAIDGHDMAQIVAALDEAMSVKEKPSVIVALTKKGKGVSFVEDKDGWHGKALKKGEELDRALAELQPKVAGAVSMSMKSPEGRSANPITIDSGAKGKAIDFKLGDQIATRE